MKNLFFRNLNKHKILKNIQRKINSINNIFNGKKSVKLMYQKFLKKKLNTFETICDAVNFVVKIILSGSTGCEKLTPTVRLFT